MPVKKQTVINFQRPAGQGVLQTRVSLKREAIKYSRVAPGILHGIDNFRKHRITGDVPSLKRHIYERSPTTTLGKGLHGAAKNAYRIYRIGKLPGKIAWSAGLAGETLLLKAGSVGIRHAGIALYQKMQNAGDNDTGRALSKAVAGAGSLLFMRRDNLLVRKELTRLKKNSAASERRLRKFVPPLLDLHKRQLKSARRCRNKAAVKRLKAKIANDIPSRRYKTQIKNYKKIAAKSKKKSVTRLINKRRAALVKHTSKLEKANLKFAKKIHRENKRLLKLAKRGKVTAALGLAGRKFAEKIGAAARENDTTAVVGAAVSVYQQLRKTKAQKLYSKQKRMSKLKKKSVKNKKEQKLRGKTSKLGKKGAGAKGKGKKRRRKPKKGLKSRLAAIVGALSNPGDAIKSLLKGAITKAAAVVIIPILPFILIGFIVSAVILSLFPSLITTYVSTYPADDSDMLSAEQYMFGLEADLQELIDKIPASYPGYNEYRYNFSGDDGGTIGHDAHALMAYLSAKYGAFKYDEVKGDIVSIFNDMYFLRINTIIEKRTRTYTYTDSNGKTQTGTQTYDYKILEINLNKTGFENLVSARLVPDLYEWYELYKETKGNRPDLFD